MLVPVIEVTRMVEVVQRGALLLQPLGELLLAVGRPAVPASALAVEVVGVVEVVETCGRRTWMGVGHIVVEFVVVVMTSV